MSVGSVGSAYSQASLLASLQTQFSNRAAAQTRSIDGQYQARLNGVELEAQRWRSFQTDLQKPRDVINGTVRRLKGIDVLIKALTRTVNKADFDTESAEKANGYAASFDSIMRSLRGRAERTSDSPNLLGDTGARRLEIPIDIHGGTQFVAQIYRGADYQILDSDGLTWKRDKNASLLRRHDAAEEPTSVGGNLKDGLRLDAIDGDQVTFTIAPETAVPQTFEGTITRKGLGLVDAWFYDGLNSKDGRARALSDLESAKRSIKQEIDRYQRILTTIDYYDTRADIRLGDFSQQTGTLLGKYEQAVAEAQGELQRQLNATMSSVAGSQTVARTYRGMFGQFATNSNGQVVGKTVADRVFGTIIGTTV